MVSKAGLQKMDQQRPSESVARDDLDQRRQTYPVSLPIKQALGLCQHLLVSLAL